MGILLDYGGVIKFVPVNSMKIETCAGNKISREMNFISKNIPNLMGQ
jgi:hypothetical protein